MSKWSFVGVEEVLLSFSCDAKKGRGVPAGRLRKAENTIFRYPSTSFAEVLSSLNTDAALILLIITFALALLIGDAFDALCGIAIIVTFYFLTASVKFTSKKRIENSYHLLLPTARILENGKGRRLSISDVEVGDFITFEAGDIIAADARIISCDNLKIAERAIDARSGKVVYKPSEKNENTASEDDAVDGSCPNMVYAGSVVISGSGSAVVVAIGSETRIVSSSEGIVLAKTDDRPYYLDAFLSFAKKLSLVLLVSVIPVTLVALISSSAKGDSIDEKYNLLFFFLSALSVAAVAMGELSVSPCESLVTKQFLPASNKKHSKDSSCVTKLSSADALADIDTVLILCPEVVYDRRRMLRGVYFSDNYYRFDLLKSSDLDHFRGYASAYFSNISKRKLEPDLKVLKTYFSSFEGVELGKLLDASSTDESSADLSVLTEDGREIYLAQDIQGLLPLTHFRYFDQSVRELNEERRKEIYVAFEKFVSTGLSVYVLLTKMADKRIVFEGLMGCGCEFPYSNGELREKMSECGIDPILVLADENETNINFAKNCGLINDDSEIAIASEYYSFRRDITDAPIGTKAYIGFGRKGTLKLTERLLGAGKRILPIIKDSSHRKETSATTVYATHSDYSLDSVRLSSSLCLKKIDVEAKRGGLFDSMLSILGCAMARLKLGIFKNCQIVSVFIRVLAIYSALLFGFYDIIPSAPVILLIGLLLDCVSRSVIENYNCIPVRASDTSLDALKMFSIPVSIVNAIVGGSCGLSLAFLTYLLKQSSVISTEFAPIFLTYALVFSQVSVLGAFIIIMKKKARSYSFSLRYTMLVLFSIALPILNHYIGEHITSLSFMIIDPLVLLFLLIPVALSFAFVLLLDRMVEGFSKPRS